MQGVFFGPNARLAEIVNEKIKLEKILVEKQSCGLDLIDYAAYIGVSLHLVESDEEVFQLIDEHEVGVSCGFGIIFSKETIAKFSNGIINIHFGDLPKYRSRHPISWAMFNGEKQIGVSFHKIDDQIDLGKLVHKYFVDRSFFDTVDQIESQIMSQMSLEFTKAVELIKESDNLRLVGGSYYPRIDHHFKSVDPSSLNYSELASLFKSQKVYGGVNILNKKMIECHAFNPELPDLYKDCMFYKCADGIVVGVK